ncbi:hypothetical protein D3C85_1514430 [compost metagenome]
MRIIVLNPVVSIVKINVKRTAINSGRMRLIYLVVLDYRIVGPPSPDAIRRTQSIRRRQSNVEYYIVLNLYPVFGAKYNNSVPINVVYRAIPNDNVCT